MFLDVFIPEFHKESACTTIFLITLTDNMIMIIEQGNNRAIFLRFCLAPTHLLQQAGRYHGLYACAIDPPDTQVSPPSQICLCSAQEREPKHPQMSFFGSKFINRPSFFYEFFCRRTTTADRHVAPWRHHKPGFSNFGSASPKWY